MLWHFRRQAAAGCTCRVGCALYESCFAQFRDCGRYRTRERGKAVVRFRAFAAKLLGGRGCWAGRGLRGSGVGREEGGCKVGRWVGRCGGGREEGEVGARWGDRAGVRCVRYARLTSRTSAGTEGGHRPPSPPTGARPFRHAGGQSVKLSRQRPPPQHTQAPAPTAVRGE